MELKLNDVYKFHYNEEWLKKIFSPYHCFDGQLIVKQGKNNELYLEDTYWSTSDNKTFTLEEALEKGELIYVCNLDEIEECNKWDLDYYNDKDIFDLSTQHNCYKSYYKRKGATKSIEKMKQVVNYKIEIIKHEIEWRNSELQSLEKNLAKLENGDMNIFI